jgi:hypothetical protein
MTETLNVNVLVAAKEEYTKQLVYILSPEIYIILLNIFNESQQLKKKRSISLKNFQIQLKKIPIWNTIIIEKNTENMKLKFPYLLDLITAIFVSHVKILACVRLKTDSKSIQVKVPNLDTFLHKIIITNAEKIYYNPDFILKKKEFVINLISETIEETIRNQIPIDKILTEYLSGVFNQDDKEEKNESLNISNLNNESNHSDHSDHSDHLDHSDHSDHSDHTDNSDHSNVSDNEEEKEPEEYDKKIYPTRPLPPSQLENDNQIEDKIETEEIKNKILFSDAIEKTLKNSDNKEESESDDEYSDIE